MANTIALVVLLATFAVCLTALVLVFTLEPRKREAVEAAESAPEPESIFRSLTERRDT